MGTGPFIDTKDTSPYHLDLKKLYNEGVQLIQDYAGDLWTDYNEHDPGVTILENLVYALVDLSYKMGFDTLDYLVNEEGYLEDNNALYEAHEILSSHPVSIHDYRKFLFDRVSDISNIWLETMDHYRVNGLYKVYLFLKPAKYFSFKEHQQGELIAYENRLKQEVQKHWPSIRNVGEDLNKNDIVILQKENIIIEANLTLNSSGNLEEILADIILKMDQYMNPEITMNTLDEMVQAGYTYDQIFEGPQLNHGFIKDEALEPTRPKRVTKAEVLSILSAIDGIIQIDNLELVRESDGKREVSEVMMIPDGKIPRFKFERALKTPTSGNEQVLKRNFDRSKNGGLTLKMRKKNTSRYLTVDYDQTIKTLRRKQALINRVYTIQGDAHSKPAKKKGTYRNWQEYFSIQNHFPAVYGINQHGLSRYESDKRKTQALQLKGYLLIFEQLIANFQSQIGNLKDLYSIDPGSFQSTYYSQPLLSAQIDQIERLYAPHQTDKEDLAQTAKRLLNKLGAFHPHLDRKSRVLDYMLALYGERFSQSTLKRIHQGFVKDGPLLIAKNKAKMLELLRYFNRNSPKAPTNNPDHYQQMSGFELKIKILLNMNLMPSGTTSEDTVLDFKGAKAIRISDVTWKNRNHIKIELVRRMEQSGGLKEIHHYAHEYPVHDLDKHTFYISQSFLRIGFYPSNYFVYHNSSNGTYYLLLKDTDDTWYVINKDHSLNQLLAIYETCLEICYTFADDDYQYADLEDCLFIDHILLRPKLASKNDPVPDADLEGFYSFNMTIIFPDWGNKFGDEAFRQLVEETVHRNTPAHILNHVLWFNPYEFGEFKDLYQKFTQSSKPETYRLKLVGLLYEKIYHQTE